ncbi:hypothetical protein CWE22_09340 [Pseudidiomarina aestuarii]|uniref:AB hydrolase-1 domain-containing protein n=1 Tax=Pseudidiomarina aestuarii TaxID=624146 RepID=A0A7Z7ESY2_9GAMM|nr:alpha/beta fold hydrolase [Pseudidiomarina aestuarii]RUO39492.1 hypothetical protein CWE22_09340 [Pseudidiomarina aestuarii]
MDFNHLRAPLFLIAIALLSGCATIVERNMLKRVPPADIFELEPNFYEEMNINQRTFCLPHLGGCTDYWFIESLDDETNEKLRFTYSLEINGVETSDEVKFLREDFPYERRGSVVLAHGYGGDKSIWLFQAMYLRFMGYNVIVPDLQGHGGSSIDQPSFGYHDAEFISALLDSLPERELPQPLIAAGVSMGGVTASRLAIMRDDVDASILFAPMAKFDDATLSVIKMMMPRFSKLLPEDSVREAVADALVAAEVPEGGADTLTYIPQLDVPTLIYVSDVDPVAPFEVYQQLAESRPHIQVQPVLGRHHVEILKLDEAMHESLFKWLQTIN